MCATFEDIIVITKNGGGSIQSTLTSTDGSIAHDAIRTATYKSVTRRLVPFLFICFVVSYLDRTNVTFAKLQFQSELGFTDSVYGIGAGTFFLGYVLFQVPSNYLVTRIGFRAMISCFMLGWGCVSTAMMLIKSPTSFFVLRFTLGAFEAGFTPAVFLYITQWYPEFRRGRVLTLIVAGAAFAGVIGGPVSGAIISGLHGYGGLSGWQWMFALQGMPAVFLGFAAYGVLPDRPSEARWLSTSQRSVIEFDLAAERDPLPIEFTHFSAAFRHPLTYILGFIYFTVVGAMYVVTFWLPTILAELSGRAIWQIGLLSALPFVAAILAQYPFAYSSDHFNERRWHLAICGVFGSVALIATIWTPGVGLTMLLFCLATSAFYAMPPVFFTLPPRFLSGPAAAASIAMVTSIGQLGGFASSYAAGFIREVTHKTAGALLMNSALLCIGMLCLLLLVPRNERDQA